MSDSLATQQQNEKPQSKKGKSLAPTNSKMSQFNPFGANRPCPLEDEEETSSETSSSSHSEESSSDDEEESNRYFVFVHLNCLNHLKFLIPSSIQNSSTDNISLHPVR